MYHLIPVYTLFPYTTLFRSVRILLAKWEKLVKHLEKAISIFDAVETAPGSFPSLFVFIDANEKLTTFSVGESRQGKIGKHTSELQSLRHLVCRLLLEKKKKV